MMQGSDFLKMLSGKAEEDVEANEAEIRRLLTKYPRAIRRPEPFGGRTCVLCGLFETPKLTEEVNDA